MASSIKIIWVPCSCPALASGCTIECPEIRTVTSVCEAGMSSQLMEALRSQVEELQVSISLFC